MRKTFYTFHLGEPLKSMTCEARVYETALAAVDRYRLALDGAGTINIFQTLHGAKNLVVKDGIAADWRAIGNDLRKALRTEREAGERKAV